MAGGRPGQCTEPGGSTFGPQLTETAQRRLGATSIAAFFRRYLMDDKRFEGMPTVKRNPWEDSAHTDVTAGRR